MATIIEMKLSEIEYLSEQVGKILKHATKVMHCLEEMEDSSEETYKEKYSKHKKYPKEECDEDYERYY